MEAKAKKLDWSAIARKAVATRKKNQAMAQKQTKVMQKSAGLVKVKAKGKGDAEKVGLSAKEQKLLDALVKKHDEALKKNKAA